MVNFGDCKSEKAKLKLGVGAGSVIGVLFFILFINELPDYIANAITKLFADDTTLIFNSKTIGESINKLKAGAMALNEWCKHNRLYINWTKTFVMFITNKRIEIPKEIKINDKTIEVVDKFKLLGVTIDNKLKFSSFIAQQCSSISRRLYMIKRHFYLPFEVKMTFFKSFILPSIDYCASLFIYINKQNLERLNKMYYLCLFILFKFNFNEMKNETVNAMLKPHGLLSFQHRITTRILTFIAKICSNQTAPVELRDSLKLVQLNNLNYELRSNNRFEVNSVLSYSKYGDLTFKSFGTKTINKLMNILDFYKNIKQFNKTLYENLDLIIKSFSKVFLKLDLKLNFYYYKSKKL